MDRKDVSIDNLSGNGFLDPINPGSKGFDWIGLSFLSGSWELILVVAAMLVSWAGGLGEVLSMPENLAAAATAAAADEAASAVDPPPKVGLLLSDDPLAAEIPLFMVMEDGGPPIDGGMDL